MEYAIIMNGRSYELPKKTMTVVEKLDGALRVDSVTGLSVRQKFEKLHKAVKEIVGEEQAEEMFGSSNLSEIDLSEVSLAVLKINEAYEKPISDYQAEQMKEKIGSIPMDKIVSMSKAAQTIANAQVLNK